MSYKIQVFLVLLSLLPAHLPMHAEVAWSATPGGYSGIIEFETKQG